jgi:hypothetical protein
MASGNNVICEVGLLLFECRCPRVKVRKYRNFATSLKPKDHIRELTATSRRNQEATRLVVRGCCVVCQPVRLPGLDELAPF